MNLARRPRYESRSSGRHAFDFDWRINGASIAEVEMAVDYDIRFGHDGNGWDDPGESDDIHLGKFWVIGKRRNPDWGGGNNGAHYFLEETYPAPDAIVALVEANIDDLLSDISEAARNVRERVA